MRKLVFVLGIFLWMPIPGICDPAATPEVQTAFDMLNGCIWVNASKYGPTAAAPQDVATAVLSVCSKEIVSYRDAVGAVYRAKTGLDPTNLENQVWDKIRPLMRSTAVRAVLEARYHINEDAGMSKKTR